MTRFLRKRRRPASFFAYFRPDIPDILRLICCHTHLTHAVIRDLENRDVIYADGSSKQDMIPGEDKAFVLYQEEYVHSMMRTWMMFSLGKLFYTSHTHARTRSASHLSSYTNSSPLPPPPHPPPPQ